MVPYMLLYQNGINRSTVYASDGHMLPGNINPIWFIVKYVVVFVANLPTTSTALRCQVTLMDRRASQGGANSSQFTQLPFT